MQANFSGSEPSDFFLEIIPFSPTMADKKTKQGSASTSKKAWWRRPSLAAAASIATILMALYYLVTPLVSYMWQDLSIRVDKHIAVKLDPMNKELDNLLNRMSFLEGQMNGLLVQKSIQDSQKYFKEGKTDLSLKSAQKASSILASAAESKLPAPSGYFVDTIEMIDGVAKVSSSPELSRKLQDARLSLADYRSSLAGELAQMSKLQFGSGQHGWVFGGTGGSSSAGSSIEGMYLDISHLTGDAVKVIPPLTGTLADNIRVRRSAFRGGFQTLDGIHWSDVIFIGTHIQYRGGQLDLDHLTFVGCTFEAPDSDRGATFAEYVALQLPRLSIT